MPVVVVVALGHRAAVLVQALVVRVAAARVD